MWGGCASCRWMSDVGAGWEMEVRSPAGGGGGVEVGWAIGGLGVWGEGCGVACLGGGLWELWGRDEMK